MSNELSPKEVEILSAITNGASDDSLKSQFGATDEEIAKLRSIPQASAEEVTPEVVEEVANATPDETATVEQVVTEPEASDASVVADEEIKG